MSFKNFSGLNTALKNAIDSADVNRVNQILDSISELRSLAQSAASEYAKMYSQVQWMKYDSDGNPTDVTPDSQDTVPSSVLSRIVQGASNIEKRLASLASGSTVTTLPNMPTSFGHQYGNFNVWIDSDSGDLILSAAYPSGSRAEITCLEVLQTMKSGVTDKHSTIGAGQITYIHGHQYAYQTFGLNMGTEPCAVYVIGDITANATSAIVMAGRTSQKFQVVLPPTGQTHITDSNLGNVITETGTIANVNSATGVYPCTFLTNLVNASSLTMTSDWTIDDWVSTINYRFFVPTTLGVRDSVTVPEITPETFCPNFNQLLSAVKRL